MLGRNDIEGVTGILKYPALRQTDKVILTNADKFKIEKIEKEIFLKLLIVRYASNIVIASFAM